MFIGIIRQKKPDRKEKRAFRAGFSAALSGWVRVSACNDCRNFSGKENRVCIRLRHCRRKGLGISEKIGTIKNETVSGFM
jgi:hypothetical protein